ncbi:MAG: sulfatase [Bryobacteraceae bacterium]
MTRREFLSSTAALALAQAGFGAQAGGAKPNVLFISIDDLNDWTGCLGGHPQARTPNLDAIAGRGVLFTNAHCAAPLCNASRAALMTGIRPSTSGIYDNNQPFRKSPVLRGAVTLSQHFMASGYRAVGGGKIYHTPYPDSASWHEYYPSQQQNKPVDPEPPNQPINGIPGSGNMDWGPIDVDDSKMGDHQVVDWAISELHRKQEQPVFLACGLYRPHLPWYVPSKYFDLHPLEKIELPNVREDDLDDVPEIARRIALRSGDHERITKHGKWKEAVQAYLACISFMDAQLGRLIDAFDGSPIARNTVVVLWSDHGWHLGEKLHWRKFSLWEESTRNVLTIVAPGVSKPGGRCGRTVSLIDIYPTLIDVCGLPARRGLEGANLTPLLRNPAAAWNRPALTTFNRNNHSVRSERWRYTRYDDGTEELYDHQSDPMEWNNLASKPEHAAVKRDLARWIPKVNAPDSVRERGIEVKHA